MGWSKPQAHLPPTLGVYESHTPYCLWVRELESTSVTCSPQNWNSLARSLTRSLGHPCIHSQREASLAATAGISAQTTYCSVGGWTQFHKDVKGVMSIVRHTQLGTLGLLRNLSVGAAGWRSIRKATFQGPATKAPAVLILRGHQRLCEVSIKNIEMAFQSDTAASDMHNGRREQAGAGTRGTG